MRTPDPIKDLSSESSKVRIFKSLRVRNGGVFAKGLLIGLLFITTLDAQNQPIALLEFLSPQKEPSPIPPRSHPF